MRPCVLERPSPNGEKESALQRQELGVPEEKQRETPLSEAPFLASAQRGSLLKHLPQPVPVARGSCQRKIQVAVETPLLP